MVDVYFMDFMALKGFVVFCVSSTGEFRERRNSATE